MTTTPDSAPESVMKRIRGYLAKAEHTEYEDERKSFMAAATSLMAKYRIERIHLAAEGKIEDKPTSKIITIDEGAWALDRARLVGNVADAMRCKAIMLNKTTKGIPQDGLRRVHVFGYESDLERAEIMFTSILLQMTSALMRLQIPARSTPRKFKHAWIIGFINGAIEMLKLAESYAEAEAEDEDELKGTGTALAILDRSAVVEALPRATYEKLVPGRKVKVSSIGFAAGIEAGRRANVGGTEIGGNRRAIS